MKNKFFSLLGFAAVIAVLSTSLAQKPKLVSGSYESISKIKNWHVSMDFGSPEIHKKGSYDKFIDDRVSALNEKEEDFGTEWLVDWNKNIDRKYTTKFCLLMNKYLAKAKGGKVTVSKKEEETQGKIIIRPYWIWLGYSNAMMTNGSKVSSKIYFLDNDGNELLVVDMVESPGNAPFTSPPPMGFAFNPEGEYARLSESFAKCGKDLAGFLSKKAFN